MKEKERSTAVPAGAEHGLSDDDAALRALRSGDERAVAGVVTAWTPSMLRLARSQVVNDAAAEDVVQEAWLAVLSGLHRFQGRSALRTWVLGIVVNIARRAGARERRVLPFTAAWRANRDETRAPAVDPDRFDPVEGSWVFPPTRWDRLPEEELSAGELRTVVEAAIASLPARQRAVITVRDVLGLGTDDVCQLFGLSDGNQRVLLHRARSRVRCMIESYVTEAADGRGAVETAAATSNPRSPMPPSNRRARQPARPRPGQAVMCRQLVELVNDYLDGGLDRDLRHRVEAHLSTCDACSGYVAQIRRLLDVTRHLTDPAPPTLLRQLAAALRATHTDGLASRPLPP